MTGAVVAVAEGMRSEGLCTVAMRLEGICTEGMRTYFEAFAQGAPRTLYAGHDPATKLLNALGAMKLPNAFGRTECLPCMESNAKFKTIAIFDLPEPGL